MRIKLTASAHHRNGICGEPFEVSLFEHDGDEYVGILLDESAADVLGSVPCFVLNMDMLKDGNVRFTENSWRGDHFADALRKAIKEQEE